MIVTRVTMTRLCLVLLCASFAVATQISVLHQGAVIAQGAPADVRANPEVQRVYLGHPPPGSR